MNEIRCVVCRSPSRKRNTPSNVLEDQLTVIYFLDKFLRYPLVKERHELQRLLVSRGNPSEWVGFCEKCVEVVERAKLLHVQLQRIQVQLEELRTTVEQRVVESFQKDEKDPDPNHFGKSIRESIYREYELREVVEDSRTGEKDDDGELLQDIHLEVELKVEKDENFARVETPSPVFFEDTGQVDVGLDEFLIEPEQSNTSREIRDNSDRLRRNPVSEVYPLFKIDHNDEDEGEPSSAYLGQLEVEDDEADEDFVASNNEDESEESGSDNEDDEDWESEKLGEGRYLRKDNHRNTGSSRSCNEVNNKLPSRRKKTIEDKTCPVCFKVFNRSDRMRTHLNVQHEKSFKYSCDICDKTFLSQESQKIHKKRHTMQEEVHGSKQTRTIEDKTCPVCFKVFHRSDRMRTHLNVQHEKSIKYSCDLCSKTFLAQESLNLHKKIHARGEGYKSLRDSKRRREEGKEVSEGKSNATKHTIKDKTCPVCFKVFPRLDRMKSHLNAKHERSILYSCDICGRPFYVQESLKFHKRTHLSHEELLQLDKTEKLTSESIEETENEGKKKLKQKYTVEDKTCPVCFKVFLRVDRMKDHLNVKHERSVTYSCEICMKTFYVRESLRLHMQTHLTDDEIRQLEYQKLEGAEILPSTAVSNSVEGENSKVEVDEVKSRTCPICQELFDSVSARRIHLENVHCPEKKNFTCDKCGKSFPKLAKKHFEAHMEWHETGIYRGRFKCLHEGCTMTFPSKIRYENHIVKHTGEKRYLCSQCGKGFTQKCGLEKHLRVIHSENPPQFVCSICGKIFKTNWHLKQHMRSISHGGPGFSQSKPQHRDRKQKTAANESIYENNSNSSTNSNCDFNDNAS